MERAARGKMGRVGRRTGDGGEAPAARGAPRRPAGDRIQQSAGIGVLGPGEDFRRRAGFHDLARVHDEEVFGIERGDPQVVRDEEEGHVQLLPQTGQELEDILLHGHVQGRGGLVGDEELRAVGDGHGDHGALPLSAGDLVRVGAVHARRIGDLHAGQEFDPASAGPPLRSVPRERGPGWLLRSARLSS